MKIRSRLIVAFLIMTVFPLCAGAASFHKTVQMQADTLIAYYSADPADYEGYGFILNPVQVLYNITSKDFNTISDIADQHPDRLLDPVTINTITRTLAGRDTFIVIRYKDEEFYVGNKECYNRMNILPYFTEARKDNNYISLDTKNSLLIRGKDFYFTDNTEGQFYLITDLSKLMPYWKNSFRDILICFLAIIVITGTILILWLYHSIVKPLDILHIATMQIGAGNLDNPVRVTSSDEIGELCRDFEEMRIRLKSILEERIQYEQNTRDMMGSISHDLKTPLTAIKGYAEGLADGVAATPGKQEKYLKTIIAKAVDMTYLVDELSLFAKIEQNALPYNFTVLNIGEYFEDCIDEIAFDLEAHNIKTNYENNTRENTLITADPEQLKRVINNITGNSVKYMDKAEGIIRITISDVIPPPVSPPLYRQINEDGTDVMPPKARDEFIQVEISDNGPGIDRRDLPFIFDRFYRADASRNSSKGGSGLGLAIVQKIISDHNGRIWAESTPGKGTSVYFTLKKKLINT
ncbi:MAG: HAMP domain-containing histidine kinase [Lachnospiraceae bacterium]|nr:HAMP domain-containing histidine kinase [Lachnospiraceae bacterium]